jgi:hypothetical protein
MVGYTFVVVGITGVIFKFILKNHPLEEIHGWLGLTMVVAAIIHIFHNWKSLRVYLREPRVLALMIPIVFAIGFFALSPGEPKSELHPREVIHKLSMASAVDVAKVFGQDVKSVVSHMRSEGLQVSTETETIDALADENHQQPEAILTYFVK